MIYILYYIILYYIILYYIILYNLESSANFASDRADSKPRRAVRFDFVIGLRRILLYYIILYYIILWPRTGNGPTIVLAMSTILHETEAYQRWRRIFVGNYIIFIILYYIISYHIRYTSIMRLKRTTSDGDESLWESSRGDDDDEG